MTDSKASDSGFLVPTEEAIIAEFRRQVRAMIAPERLEEFDSNPQAQILLDVLGTELCSHYKQKLHEIVSHLSAQEPTSEDAKERLLRLHIMVGSPPHPSHHRQEVTSMNKSSEALAALDALRNQIMAAYGSADYDTAAVARHLRSVMDSIQHEKGSAIEGDFATQGGGGNPL